MIKEKPLPFAPLSNIEVPRLLSSNGHMRARDALLFFAGLCALLVFQYRNALAEGHCLYTAVIEDPAARWSFFPWDILSARLLHSGRFPLWNHLSGAGMPLLANLQSATCFPLKWPYFAFPHVRVLDAMVVLRLALAGTFTFMLCRRLGLSRAASALAGAAFAHSGYFVKHANMVNVSSEMWAPLIMLLLLPGKGAKRKAGRVVLEGLAFYLVFTGGSPEAATYTTLLCAGFFLFMHGGRPGFAANAATLLAGPLVLGALLSSVQTAPFIEYLGAGWHIHGPQLHEIGAHPVEYISSLVAPWFFGPSGSHPAQLVSVPHVGAAVFMLALTGLMSRRRNRAALFFAGCIALLLPIVYQLPPAGLLARVFPFNRFGNVKFAMAGATLAFAVLAAMGADALARGAARGKTFAPALAVAALLLLGGALNVRGQAGSIVPGGLLTPLASLAACAALMAASFSRGRQAGARAGAAAGLCLVAVLELMVLFYGYRIESEMDPAMLRFKDPAVPEVLRPITADPGHPRFTGMEGALHQNMNLLFAAADLRAFDGLYPRRYVRAMSEIEGFDMEGSVQAFFEHGWSFDVSRENLDHALVDLMGVRYAVSASEIEAAGFSLSRHGLYKLYRNKEARERAWLEPGGAKSAEVSLLLSDRVEIKTRGSGRLVLSDVHFPGWRAHDNGRESVITPWLGLFRSVAVRGGTNEVIMVYRPWGFRLGLWCAIAALAAAAVFVAYAGRNKG